MRKLNNWCTETRSRVRLFPESYLIQEGKTNPDNYVTVLDIASMNEEKQVQYCRQRGLHPEQIADWRAACELANDYQVAISRQDHEEIGDLRCKQKALELENHRKNKALTEAAPLVILENSAPVLWGYDEDA